MESAKPYHFNYWYAFYLIGTLLLGACGGGGGGNSENEPETAATPILSFIADKTFRFEWTDVSDATFYRVQENPDSLSGFSQIGDDITTGTQSYSHRVPLYARIDAQYMLQSCNDSGCVDSAILSIEDSLSSAIGYFKSSNPDLGDVFGRRIALNAEGNTMAVSSLESSNAIGVNGNQADNSTLQAGAVYLFERDDTGWRQRAYLKASNTDALDFFGESIAISDDGNTLVVGSADDSMSTGFNGNQSDNSADVSGAVYHFVRSGTTWSQQSYIKASNTDANDRFSVSIDISGDGKFLVVGASHESSNASGINGNQADNTLSISGAAYVFDLELSQQVAYIKATNPDSDDGFGTDVAISSDGNFIAIGAPSEDSSATNINGDESDNAANDSGAVYIFNRNGTSWNQQAYIKPSNGNSGDSFGTSVTLDDDGDTLVVGSPGEDSNTTHIDGNQLDNTVLEAGAAYVFNRSGPDWSQQAYIKVINTANDQFGAEVVLDADGETLVVGARNESSNANGINGDPLNNLTNQSGAAYVFVKNQGSWQQQSYLKASNTDITDLFGASLALSRDGKNLAVGAANEDSDAIGISGDPDNEARLQSGAVYLY